MQIWKENEPNCKKKNVKKSDDHLMLSITYSAIFVIGMSIGNASHLLC